MTFLATIICAACLIQFTSGQIADIPACVNATLAMSGNPECAIALSSSNSTLICNGTCRDVLDDIMSNCENEVSYT